MREQEHFDFFRNTILPDVVRRRQGNRTLSIWSAGCASGEEPYTISMMQYQKSYSAACRLMTTLDEVLDKLINGTGVTGR